MNCRTLDCCRCGRPFSVYDALPDAGRRCPYCLEQQGVRAMLWDIYEFFRRWTRIRKKLVDAGNVA